MATTILLASLGAFLRYGALSCLKDSPKQRVELSTPINDWKRAYEAVHLWNSGLDPYGGNVFHEYPISMQFYKFIINYFNTDLVFIGTDVVTGILLQHSVRNQILLTETNPESAKSRGFYTLMIHLFSPLSIISCASGTTSIFTNFLIALIGFIIPIQTFKLLTCVLVAILGCNNIHYSTLILPTLLCLEYFLHKQQSQNQGEKSTPTTNQKSYYHESNFYSSLMTSFIVCTATVSTLMLTSYLLMDRSTSFFKSTYFFALTVEDLTPNIGMFWYFFTEMFEHFLSFFTWLVQLNAFMHVIPLCIGLRDKPTFAFFMTILISTIFQPYPSISNVNIILSLLPQWSNLFIHMRHGLKIICAAVTCMSLWPVFWYLWIVMGTANANYYFSATLAFTSSLIVLMIDLLNAYSFSNKKCLD